MSKVSLRRWHNRYKSIAFWWVTGLGTGMIKPAPGTWGSAFGLLIVYPMLAAGISEWTLITSTILLTVISSWVIDKIESKTGIHDAPEIVIDEIAGQWIALLPLLAVGPSFPGFLLAFLLFRFFDILKPWPIGWLDQHTKGGFGVMVDDIVAGAMSAFIIWLLLTHGMLDGIIT